MKFQKGEFRDIKWNEINIETDSKLKDESVSYPSAEIACTRDNIKSFSTTTTLNKLDRENSSKWSYIRGLRFNKCNTDQCEQDKISEESKSQLLEGDSDSAYSPPLARQLFSRHELFDNTELVDTHESAKFIRHEWLTEEVDQVRSPHLNIIKEDSNSSKFSNTSSSKYYNFIIIFSLFLKSYIFIRIRNVLELKNA